jgi:hypothetical protein
MNIINTTEQYDKKNNKYDNVTIQQHNNMTIQYD